MHHQAQLADSEFCDLCAYWFFLRYSKRVPEQDEGWGFSKPSGFSADLPSSGRRAAGQPQRQADLTACARVFGRWTSPVQDRCLRCVLDAPVGPGKGEKGTRVTQPLWMCLPALPPLPCGKLVRACWVAQAGRELQILLSHHNRLPLFFFLRKDYRMYLFSFPVHPFLADSWMVSY